MHPRERKRLYAALSQCGPYVDSVFGCLVTGYDEAQRALALPVTDRAWSQRNRAQWLEQPVGAYLSDAMVFLNAPEHAPTRAAQAAHTSPKACRDLHDEVASIVRRCFDDLDAEIAARGHADSVALVLHRIPNLINSRLLGFPERDAARVARWTRAFSEVNDIAPPPRLFDVSGRAAEELQDYLRDGGMDSALISACRARPQELSRQIAFFLGASTDTSASFLAHLMVRVQEARPALDDAEERRAVIEETLRLDPPVVVVPRFTPEPLRLGPVRVPADGLVFVVLHLANRDPRVFGPDPDAWAPGTHQRKALTFGHGRHHCIGSYLLQQQADLILQEMAQRAPYQFGAIEYTANVMVHSVDSLLTTRAVPSDEAPHDTPHDTWDDARTDAPARLPAATLEKV